MKAIAYPDCNDVLFLTKIDVYCVRRLMKKNYTKYVPPLIREPPTNYNILYTGLMKIKKYRPRGKW